MITLDGYTVYQYAKTNRIIISLPQTETTVINTIMPISNRRLELTDTEQMCLLLFVKALFEGDKQSEEGEPDVNTD